MSRITIEVSNMRFLARHGLYAEEMKVATEFEVHLAISLKAPKKHLQSLEETVNYVEIYRIIKEEMNERRQLLETFAMEVTERLATLHSKINNISFTIKKLHPPVEGFTGSVGITYQKKF